MRSVASISIVECGEFVSLAGPSGSGKSTLLNLIGALDRPSSGEVIVDGVALATLDETQLADLRLNKIGFVFQAYNLIPVLSARENVEFIMQLQGVPSRRAPRALARGTCVARYGRACRQPPGANVGRPATTGCSSARDRHAAGVAAGRRTEREPRFGNDERTAGTAATRQRRTRRHDRNGNARSDGDELRAQASAACWTAASCRIRGLRPKRHERDAATRTAVLVCACCIRRRLPGISMRERACSATPNRCRKTTCSVPSTARRCTKRVPICASCFATNMTAGI